MEYNRIDKRRNEKNGKSIASRHRALIIQLFGFKMSQNTKV